MSELRVASRYAKSLLELAAEKNVLDEVHNDMQQLAKLSKDNRDFYLMLKNPIIRHDKKRAILKAIFKDANQMTLAIFDIISKKNREGYLPLIAQEFHNQYNVHQGIERAEVTTAVALDAKLRGEIEKLVAQISKFDKVELIEKVDEDIIGGYILQVGDRQIDDSLKTKLKALNVKFSQNPYIKEF